MDRGKKPPCDVTVVIWNTAKEIKDNHAGPRRRLRPLSHSRRESIHIGSIFCMEKREEIQMTEFLCAFVSLKCADAQQ